MTEPERDVLAAARRYAAAYRHLMEAMEANAGRTWTGQRRVFTDQLPLPEYNAALDALCREAIKLD